MARKYKVAYIKENDVALVIIPVDPSFGAKSQSEKEKVVATLQRCASSAGFAGRVIPVWREGTGHGFIAPPEWHPFFKSLDWHFIVANINRELVCE